jgi:histidinol-phosphate aminotransferase
MTVSPVPKPWIAAIRPYVPGRANGGGGQALVKLSANENPLGCSPLALAAREAAPMPSRYPDPESVALREAIGKARSIPPARVVMGTGSDELLHLAVQGYAGLGDEVLFSRYSFSVYEIAARRSGATPVEAPDVDYATDVDQLIGHLTPRTRVVFVANPNNPTGSFLPRAELARLHAALPDEVLLVVDQAYAEYLDPADDDGALELAVTHGNVLVTRTFSKIFGLAGERVGWATGAAPLIETLNRIRGPFNVTNSAQAMALAALEDSEFVERSRSLNRTERERFAASLAALSNRGIRVLPSEANFVLVLFEGALSAESALAGIAEAGFAVRHLPGQGLPHALRITIGLPHEMDAIAAKLREMAEASR